MIRFIWPKRWSFGLQRLDLVAAPALERLSGSFRDDKFLTQLECVVVGDHDFSSLNIAQHVGRRDFARAIVAFRVVRQQDTQAVADRDARGDDQEPAGELLAVRVTHGVHRLPRYQHRHDGGFARPGRELQRKAHQFGIGLFVGPLDVCPELGDPRPHLRCDLCQPDCGFNSLDLAEEGADALELVVPPMLQQSGCFRCHEPLVWVRKIAPRFDISPNLVYDRGGVVFLIRRRKIVVSTE